MLSYIGSKKSLIPFIDQVISPHLTSKSIFCDLFGGTGVVGLHFDDKCASIISNDVEYYSFVILTALMKCSFNQNVSKIIEQLNSLEPKEGLCYTHFAKDRMFFTPENAKKIDAIREKIEEIHIQKIINDSEYYFLLASLLCSLDKIANTASVYAAYFKKL